MTLLKKISFQEWHALSQGSWTVDCSRVTSTWLGYTIQEEIHPIFLPWKMEMFSSPVRCLLTNLTEQRHIMREWKGANNSTKPASALPLTMLFVMKEGETKSRSVRWEGGREGGFLQGGCITGQSYNTLFPLGKRLPGSSNNSFYCGSSWSGRSCSLEKAHSCFLFSEYFLPQLF